jgi:peptidoglycan/xylan/chitin deacetylase (PgdA/CDA1 family)
MPLSNLAGMAPFKAVRALIDAVPAAALEQMVRTLEGEDSTPKNAYSYSVTWEMLDRIRRAGIVIGSHTKTHVVLTHETPECVVEEVVGSRQELQRRLGTAVPHFAYPSGIYNSATLSAVAAAGYRFGFTTCTHRSSEYPLLTVPRTLLWENACLDAHRAFSESVMRCQVQHAFDLMSRCHQQHASSGRVRQAYAAL